MTGAARFAYPIMVDVRDQPVFVAGGGHDAAAKARVLADLGARVQFWLPGDDTDGVAAGRSLSEHEPSIVFRRGTFHRSLLENARLVIVDTGDRELDHRVAAEARGLGVLVNTVDDLEYCDWSAPAVLRRGDLTVAIATAGLAPALAVRLRDRLAELIGPEHGTLLALLGESRPRIMSSGRSFEARRRLWYELVDGPALEHLRAGREAEAKATLHSTIATWEGAE